MTKTLQLFFIMLTFISINTVYGQAPGTLDESFGIAGKVTFDFRKTDMLKSILIQPDGKILAFGNTKETNGGNDFVVVRYNSNGTLDPSFGSSGVRAINLGSDEEEFLEMQLQSDGKLVVVGRGITVQNEISFVTVRLTSNGSFDPSFGIGGVTYTVIGTSASGSLARSVAIQSDNKIVVNGQAGGGNSVKSATVRYNVGGSIDNTFNSGQPVLNQMANYGGFPNKVIIQNDGKIVVVGYGNEQFSQDNPVVILRYTSSGALDATFGTNGKVTTLIANPQQTSKDEAFGFSVAQQSDGKLLVCGYSTSGFSSATLSTLSSMFVARYTINGTLDNTFGNQGVTLIPANGGSYNSAYSVLTMPNGKIIVSGIEIASSYSRLKVVRLNSDGIKDGSFGSNGYADVYLENTLNISNYVSAAIQSDGKIVAGISFNNNSDYDFMIVRFHNTEDISGILDYETTNGMSVYPNPASNEINFCVKEKLVGSVYSITDLYGKQVKTGVFDKNTTTVNTEEFAAGMYLIKTANAGVMKFIKK